MANETNNEGHLLDNPSPGLARLLKHNDFIFAMGVAMVLVTLLIPLPTFLMDMLLAMSIAASLAVLVTVLATHESLEFSTFPSLLLFMTLFRLSINVASTRLILLQGDAGKIIETFGSFVAGGQLVIGLVVFLILVVIQFVVITKGSERISEVAARFNLDAMPGKQMAIDADLNAGLIGEAEARARREKIARESEFYGAMDGASKFVRGDAVAGLIITAVNLVGGFIMGMTKGMTAGESVRMYSILAVGDGLVSQIPALIVATSAGFLTSKTSTKDSISRDLTRQFLARSRPMGIASFLLGAMIFVPGFPKIPFAVLAITTGLLSRSLRRQEAASVRKTVQTKTPDALPGKAGSAVESADAAKSEEPPIEELLDVDRISIQVGARLIKIVDPRRKGSLAQRIGPLRRKFAQQFGVVLPLVRLRDNVQLENNTYEIRLNNHVVSSGQIEPEKLLAMDSGIVTNPIPGIPANEPVFNLPALWILTEQKEQAELAGYTVVDPETVMITHLSEILRKYAYELLSRDDVQLLVDRLREKQPALVNGVIGESVTMGLLHRVLQNLLRDGIPICDLPKIIEALGDHALRTKDAGILTELTRKSLARTITEQYREPGGAVMAITFDPGLEYELCNRLTAETDTNVVALPPDKAMTLAGKIVEGWKTAMEAGHENVVLLCDYRIRAHLAGMLERQVPQLPVVAYDEVAVDSQVQTVAIISMELEESDMLAAAAG
ncbi:MAG: flagellar biosynthesis protein FlhA [Phycisphaerae bacterium]|nr:flagellar biosynthesis protein FlhA [Phycisphaerae bacterium]